MIKHMRYEMTHDQLSGVANRKLLEQNFSTSLMDAKKT